MIRSTHCPLRTSVPRALTAIAATHGIGETAYAILSLCDALPSSLCRIRFLADVRHVDRARAEINALVQSGLLVERCSDSWATTANGQRIVREIVAEFAATPLGQSDCDCEYGHSCQVRTTAGQVTA